MTSKIHLSLLDLSPDLMLLISQPYFLESSSNKSIIRVLNFDLLVSGLLMTHDENTFDVVHSSFTMLTVAIMSSSNSVKSTIDTTVASAFKTSPEQTSSCMPGDSWNICTLRAGKHYVSVNSPVTHYLLIPESGGGDKIKVLCDKTTLTKITMTIKRHGTCFFWRFI